LARSALITGIPFPEESFPGTGDLNVAKWLQANTDQGFNPALGMKRQVY